MIMCNFKDRVRGEDPSNLPSQTPGSSRPAAPALSTGRAVEHSVFGSWTSNDKRRRSAVQKENRVTL